MVNLPTSDLTAKQREALRRLSRRGVLWSEAYQVDVSGSTLGRLLTQGLVDAKAPNDLRATRYKINEAGRQAIGTHAAAERIVDAE